MNFRQLLCFHLTVIKDYNTLSFQVLLKFFLYLRMWTILCLFKSTYLDIKDDIALRNLLWGWGYSSRERAYWPGRHTALRSAPYAMWTVSDSACSQSQHSGIGRRVTSLKLYTAWNTGHPVSKEEKKKNKKCTVFKVKVKFKLKLKISLSWSFSL